MQGVSNMTSQGCVCVCVCVCVCACACVRDQGGSKTRAHARTATSSRMATYQGGGRSRAWGGDKLWRTVGNAVRRAVASAAVFRTSAGVLLGMGADRQREGEGVGAGK